MFNVEGGAHRRFGAFIIQQSTFGIQHCAVSR
jgi:hypothetical protein